jgi:hypothetical protein
MSKIKAFWNKFIDIVDDFLAFIMTIIGMLASNYLPLLKTSGTIHIEADWWRLVLSAIGAVIIIGQQEKLSPDEDGDISKARKGRRKKFGMRMWNALSQGMAWAQYLNLTSN